MRRARRAPPPRARVRRRRARRRRPRQAARRGRARALVRGPVPPARAPEPPGPVRTRGAERARRRRGSPRWSAPHGAARLPARRRRQAPRPAPGRARAPRWRPRDAAPRWPARPGPSPSPRRARLGLRLGCLDDRVAAQALGVGQSTDAIRGGIVDAGRMTLDADLQALGEIEHHLVLDAELPRQLVDPDLLRSQACCLLPLLLGHQFRAQTADVVVLDRGAQRPADGSPSLRLVEALRRMVPAEPGTPPRSRPGLQPGRGATEAHQLLHGRHPPAPDAGPDGRDPSRASRQPPPSNRP